MGKLVGWLEGGRLVGGWGRVIELVWFLVGWLVGFLGKVTSLSGIQLNRSPGTFMHRIMRHVGLVLDTTAMTVNECYTREGAIMPSWLSTLTCIR